MEKSVVQALFRTAEGEINDFKRRIGSICISKN